MKRVRLLAWICYGLFFSSVQAKEIHIGILDWRSLENFQQHWLPALESLQQQMPEYHLEILPMSLDRLSQAVADGELDLVITNPGHYVALSVQHEVAPIAQLQHLYAGLPMHHVGSVLLTHRDRPDLDDLQKLRRARIGAVSPDSFGGYQVMLDVIRREGLNPDSLDWQFSGFPMEQLIDQLLAGDLDLVIVRSCLVEMLAIETGLQLSQLRPVSPTLQNDYACMTSSPLYPGWPLLRTERIAEEVVRKVLAALMQSEAVQLNDDLMYWQPPVSYQSVYDLFERLRIGPFAAFPHNPLWHWLYQYRHIAFGAMVLLLLVAVHHIRAEYLVRRRTRELELSQQRQRAAELAAQQHQEELRHASRFTLLGELAASLAHELNQPLTAIANYARGSVRHLQREDTELLQKRKQLTEVAEQIAGQAELAAAVIRNIRSFLKKDAGEFSWLNIEALIQDALLFCQSRLQQAGVQPEVQIPVSLPVIFSHRTHLLQILANLMTNALDAMEEQKPSLKSLILTVEYHDETGLMVFRVADNGKGIDPVIAPRLFEPFTTSRQAGMGLGLSLSRSLAESLGGELTLVNRPSGGAVAELSLPANPTGPQESLTWN